jgi:hypothetical protein
MTKARVEKTKRKELLVSLPTERKDGQITQELVYYDDVTARMVDVVNELLENLSPLCIYRYCVPPEADSAPELAPIAFQLHILTSRIDECVNKLSWLRDNNEL